MKADQNRSAQTGLGLLEEATQLLRESPASTFLCYYLGSIPFILFALFFLADMSRSADAAARCVRGAAILTVLYFWMRGWQSVFCERLLARVEGRDPERISLSVYLAALIPQLGWQAIALLALPLSLLVVFPFGWIFALHQNLMIVSARPAEYAHPWKVSFEQAMRWPAQNHSLLLLCVVVVLFALLNVATVVFTLPGLLKMLWGSDLIATRHALSLLNTTVIAGILAVTYLICDPLIRAAYVLRCFYGVAQRSGADLRASLRRNAARAVTLSALFCFLAVSMAQAATDETGKHVPPNARATVRTEPLDQALEKVIQQREYSWRMPREKESESRVASGFWEEIQKQLQDGLAAVGKHLQQLAKSIFEAITKVVNWIFSKFPGKKPGAPPGPWGLEAPPAWLVITVILALVGGGFLWFYFKKLGRAKKAVLEVQSLVTPPDLTDENLTADQLSEDNWLKLAATLAEQGNYRLSLRALYLASLAHLSRREIIQITRSKSNHDYSREVQRRGRTWEGLPEAFQENLGTFERIWYGMYEANREIHQQFQQNLQRIRAC